MLSTETVNQALRLGLQHYAGGHSDGGALARLLLADPDAARSAVETYERKRDDLVDATLDFLGNGGGDTTHLERLADDLMEMRGAHSFHRLGVRDRRSPRRRR